MSPDVNKVFIQVGKWALISCPASWQAVAIVAAVGLTVTAVTVYASKKGVFAHYKSTAIQPQQ